MIITNDDAQNALKNGMKLIQGVQLEIQKLKGTKVSFILAGLQERTLFDQE